jgi:hypothetical protein
MDTRVARHLMQRLNRDAERIAVRFGLHYRCIEAESPYLKVRPIRHRLEGRVRAHIFLCMLAYYVQWHLLEAWRPLLFCDEAHPFQTLLKLLSGIVRNVCRIPDAPPDAPTFDVVTKRSATQQRAYELLEAIEP